jgi:hypothetical protein
MNVVAKQTYGQICLSGGKSNDNTHVGCPATTTERAKELTIIEEGIDTSQSCIIESVLCESASATCPTSTAGLPTYTADVKDGEILIMYSNTSTNINYKRSFYAFNVASNVIL